MIHPFRGYLVGCLAFLAVPALIVAEVYAGIAVAGRIGWFWALLWILATMSLGGSLVRSAGLETLSRARAAMNRGETPARSMFDGACTLAAGALFAFPGFLTDGLAVLLMLPPVRWVLYRMVAGRVRRAGASMHANGSPGFGRGSPGVFVWTFRHTRPGAGASPDHAGPRAGGTSQPGGIIDAEWSEVEDDGSGSGPRSLPPGGEK